jgi:putative adenylate-forming enzyme
MNVPLIANVLWKRRQLRRHDRWTRRQLETHQTRALHLLREYAYARSPFYQRFHKGFADLPLHELPVLTKSLLMEHFDEMITDRDVCLRDVEVFLASLCGNERFRDRYWVNATSGSTGRRGLFLFDFAEWTTVLASYARVYEWGGALPSLTHRIKMAVVSTTTPWHQSAQVGATVQSWWTPTLRLDATSPTEEIDERLNAWQPETLVSYASTADLLAKEQLAGRLHITPGAVFTASEVLTQPMRERIAQAWGQQPLNVYGATESATIAAECNLHSGLHLFEDLVITEVVDEHNHPVPPGTSGEKVFITVLFSRTQPLIRYEMSDQVQLAKSLCPCGRPYACLEMIQGRVEDVLHFPAFHGGWVAVHPNVFHEVLDLLPVSGWQIVQRAHGLSVLVSGMPDDFSDAILIDALRHSLAMQGAIAPPVSIERIAAVPRGAIGKAALIRSELPQGEVTTREKNQ